MISPKPNIQKIVRIHENDPSRFNKVRMDRNERTHPFSDEFLKRVKNRIDGEVLMTYPEPGPLYESFASFLKQPKERLLFHTGSDLCIKAIFETYISPHDKILLHRPGYAMFRVYSNIFEANIVFQDFDSELNFDYERYINSIDNSFKMAVLENPNGFVGVAPTKEILYNFINKCEEEGVIAVIDEAYFFFHDITAADFIGTYENLIVVRTFSKAFGLAGLRAGYILSHKDNIENISKVNPMHELNGFAILVIDELLNDDEEFFSFIEITLRNLQYLKDEFTKIGIETSESVANFLAVRLGKYIDVTELKDKLQKEGFLIRRPFTDPHLNEWVRIGTSPVQHEQHVLNVVKEMMNETQ